MGRDDLHEKPGTPEAGEVFESFMARLLNHPQVKPLLSDQHFSVGQHADRGLGLTAQFPSKGWQR
jgi:hypothetical protein